MFDNFRWGFSCTRYCCYIIVIHGIKVHNTQFIINSLYLLKSVHGYLKKEDTVPLLCRMVVIYMYSLNRCECKITINASQINPEFRVGDESWAGMAGLRKNHELNSGIRASYFIDHSSLTDWMSLRDDTGKVWHTDGCLCPDFTESTRVRKHPCAWLQSLSGV